jgi:ribonuclease D
MTDFKVEMIESPLERQVAGGHYKSKRIQPVTYIHANNLNFLEGCIVKRITRWRDKPAENRFADLEKIIHEVELLIEMEKRYGES